MNFLTHEIGSAKDNLKEPIHNWYRFTAGFSHQFVTEIIRHEKLKERPGSKIFDPFTGCGTTLVSAQKSGIKAVGNEAQQFMFNIIKAKLNWNIDSELALAALEGIREKVLTSSITTKKESAFEFMRTLYTADALRNLFLIKRSVAEISSVKLRLFFNLALSQTLHRTSVHPIAIPYIVRSKFVNPKPVWSEFKGIVLKMLSDIEGLKSSRKSSKVYLQDSRLKNVDIEAGSCSLCITSPPYLNNLDYGEVSKTHTHFFGLTNSWSDVTNMVRRNLVTSSTTHYSESEFDISEFRDTEFYKASKAIANRLEKTASEIKKIIPSRAGKKSFDVLTLLYFKDMFEVLKEIDRVVEQDGKAFLILGDSAPYGIFIPTTKIIGEMAKTLRFKKYRIHKIRSRGSKWKDLRFRHNLPLSENLLVIQK